MKQKDKDLSRLFSKNCPQKVGEGKRAPPPPPAEKNMEIMGFFKTSRKYSGRLR
jgi:hypothetical protein